MRDRHPLGTLLATNPLPVCGGLLESITHNKVPEMISTTFLFSFFSLFFCSTSFTRHRIVFCFLESFVSRICFRTLGRKSRTIGSKRCRRRRLALETPRMLSLIFGLGGRAYMVGRVWEIERDGQEGSENDRERKQWDRRKKVKGLGGGGFIINLRSIPGACARSSSRQSR